MSANNLLLWMSARKRGSWPQFRAAVEELHVADAGATDTDDDQVAERGALPIYQLLRLNLQRLGHAEFFSTDGAFEWRVSPPALAVSEHQQGWIGVLVGARSRNLVERVASAGVEIVPVPSCPDQFRLISSKLAAFNTAATHVQVPVQYDAAPALLACLPPVDDPAVRHEVALPFGAEWRIERFDPTTLGWKAALRQEAVETGGGFFRFTLRYRTDLLYCTRGRAFRVPGQVGKYLALRRRRRRIVEFDPSKRELSFPSSCRPPFLIERALILCSGVPPTYERSTSGGVVRYPDISEQIASMTSALLRQELR